MMTTFNERLTQIIKKVREGEYFYSLLNSEEEALLEQKGLEYALYSLTGDDTIKDVGVYEKVELPDHLNAETNKELKDIFYFAKTDVRVIGSYWNLKIDDGFVLDEIANQSDWELSGADVLATLFSFDEYEDAEELANKLELESYYFSDTIQIQYFITYDEAENVICNDEDLYNKRGEIVDMIEALDNYDIKKFDEFKEAVLMLEF